MKNKLGTICMILGAALVLGALSLFIYNQREAAKAEQATANILPQIFAEIEHQRDSFDSSATEMKEVEIDGYAYIGYLSIPKLELELPIMADWDYTRLKIAPCRYTGSVRGEDLVIMAHNYTKHFGRLSGSTEGDRVIFTDMNGITTNYEVVGWESMAPTAVVEMTSGEFDLTLFTCTYGGQKRITVYCERLK